MDAGPLADWELAERVAWAVGSRGSPQVTAPEVDDLRADIRQIVARADQFARAATGLGDDLGPADVRVVGRREWIRSNVASIAYLTDPVADQIITRSGVSRAMARKVLALQLGVVFGYLSTKVLGQYEVFLPGGVAPGRLTLVGPNLIQLERTLLPDSGVDASEFRMGVCLHELAHRLQFEGVEWLRPTLKGLLDTYLAETRLDVDRVRQALEQLRGLVRNPQQLFDLQQLIQIVLTPDQREILEQAQNLMSLLEGHGNVVMDWGAEVASAQEGLRLDPSRVRKILNRRRSSPADEAVRRALGVSMKAEQYRAGERFILAVADRHGRGAFNRVWDDAENVPNAHELRDPDAWVARVGARS